MTKTKRKQRVVNMLLSFVMSFASVVGVFSTGEAHAQEEDTVPNLVNYQGRLYDIQGDLVHNPSPGEFMSFEIYDSETDGTLLWDSDGDMTTGPTYADGYFLVSIVKGAFNIYLGDTNKMAALPDDVFTDGLRYLQVYIEDEPLTPRTMITPVPYAVNADYIDGRSWEDITNYSDESDQYTTSATFNPETSEVTVYMRLDEDGDGQPDTYTFNIDDRIIADTYNDLVNNYDPATYEGDVALVDDSDELYYSDGDTWIEIARQDLIDQFYNEEGDYIYYDSIQSCEEDDDILIWSETNSEWSCGNINDYVIHEGDLVANSDKVELGGDLEDRLFGTGDVTIDVDSQEVVDEYITNNDSWLELTELADCTADDEILKWDSVNGWQCAVDEGGVETINNVVPDSDGNVDITTSTPTYLNITPDGTTNSIMLDVSANTIFQDYFEDYLLQYVEDYDEWIEITDLEDCNSNGQILRWSSFWDTWTCSSDLTNVEIEISEFYDGDEIYIDSIAACTQENDILVWTSADDWSCMQFEDLNDYVVSGAFNEGTQIMTLTRKNGDTVDIDLQNLVTESEDNYVTNATYNDNSRTITLTLRDGSTVDIDISALTVDTSGIVTGDGTSGDAIRLSDGAAGTVEFAKWNGTAWEISSIDATDIPVAERGDLLAGSNKVTLSGTATDRLLGGTDLTLDVDSTEVVNEFLSNFDIDITEIADCNLDEQILRWNASIDPDGDGNFGDWECSDDLTGAETNIQNNYNLIDQFYDIANQYVEISYFERCSADGQILVTRNVAGSMQWSCENFADLDQDFYVQEGSVINGGDTLRLFVRDRNGLNEQQVDINVSALNGDNWGTGNFGVSADLGSTAIDEGDTLGVITSTNGIATTINGDNVEIGLSADLANGDDYINSLVYNNGTRRLTVGRTDGWSTFVDLSGLAETDDYLVNATLNGTTLELTMQSGNIVTVDLASLQDGNDYVNAASFNAVTGVVTLTRTDGGTVAVDISAIDTDTDNFVTGASLTGTILTLTMDSGPSHMVDLSSLQDGTGTDDQNLTVGAGTATTSIINIEDGTDVTLAQGANIALTENTATNTITIAATGLQSRVTGTCAAGSSIRVINSDGSVVCELDDLGGGAGDNWGTQVAQVLGSLTGNGTAANPLAVDVDSCAAGSSIRQVNADGTVVCEPDTDTVEWTDAGAFLRPADANTVNVYETASGGFTAGSIVPTTDDSSDLGGPSNRWRDVYVGPASVHVGTTANDTILSQGSLTTTTGNFNINPAGNVGIGMINAGQTPQVKLEVSATGSATIGGEQLRVGQNNGSTYGRRLGIGYDTTGDFAFLQSAYIYPAPGSGTRNLSLQPVGGNVGIGTTAPTAKLHVSGGLRVENLVNCDTIDTDASGNLVCGTDASGAGGGNIVDTLSATLGAGNTTGNQSILFPSNSSYGIRLAGDGMNVGQVTGTAGVSIRGGSVTEDADGNGTSTDTNYEFKVRGGYSTASGSGAGMDIFTARWGTQYLQGNVGIGITNPSEKLHVDGNVRVSSLAGGGNVLADENGILIRGGGKQMYTGANLSRGLFAGTSGLPSGAITTWYGSVAANHRQGDSIYMKDFTVNCYAQSGYEARISNLRFYVAPGLAGPGDTPGATETLIQTIPGPVDSGVCGGSGCTANMSYTGSASIASATNINYGDAYQLIARFECVANQGGGSWIHYSGPLDGHYDYLFEN